MEREARIKLIAEGVSRAAAGVREVDKEVAGLGKSAGMAQSVLGEVGKVALRMASDAARAANDVKPISFSSVADSAKRFDDVVTRLAVRSNRDIGQLKQQFRDTGKEIGVLPDRVANAARALTKMTGSTDAAEAMRDLGTEANDTDRSIEEMVEVGATLYNKLGVPLGRVGDALRTVRSTAEQFATVGGHLALENSLVRLAPLLAKFSGGVRQGAASLAVFGKGQTPEVAEESSAAILGALGSADPLLVTRTLRQVSGNRNYRPYERDAQGRVTLKSESMSLLHKRLKNAPYGAVLRLFGNNVTATEQFLKSKPEEIVDHVAQQEFHDDTWFNRAFNKWVPLGHRSEPPPPQAEAGASAHPAASPVRSFAATAAGRRAVADVERNDIALDAGDAVQRQRDKRNELYRNHRTAQTVVDTLKGYAPSVVERGADVVEAIAVEKLSQPNQPTAAAQTPTVRIDTNSLRGLAEVIRSMPPPVVRTGNSPAAQAVEDSKAKNRGAANF